MNGLRTDVYPSIVIVGKATTEISADSHGSYPGITPPLSGGIQRGTLISLTGGKRFVSVLARYRWDKPIKNMSVLSGFKAVEFL